MLPTESALVFGSRGNSLALDVSWLFLQQDSNAQIALGDQSGWYILLFSKEDEV
jgi:hypothetical protein